MSPEELRAFRESLGLSRREFAPKLFISEPTLERWERGQGGPRDIHLHILRGMRERLSGAQPDAYFQYDAASDPDAAELLPNTKQLVIETLRGVGNVLLEEAHAEDGSDWSLRFSPSWAVGQPIRLALVCDGSDRPARPAIDFTLEVTADRLDLREVADAIQRLCFRHGVSCTPPTKSSERSTIELRQRVFRTGCNPATLKHVLRNYQSCWPRLEKTVLQARSAVERVAT